MARGIYNETMALAQSDGTLKALSGIQVYVYLAGTSTIATIYQSRSGGATVANPMLTDATGAIRFWAEYGEYDIRTVDTIVPARIADTTVGWNPAVTADSGIPGAKIAKDAGMSLANLGADITRQHVPLGAVLDWWRPAATVDVGNGAGNPPAGFEICDGRTVLQANHDFGAIGSISVPDMRNKFVLGADIAKADGTAAAVGDGSANAPGIRGTGGSNAAHSHSVPAHSHGLGTLAVSATNTDHIHGGTTGGMNSNAAHSHAATSDGASPNSITTFPAVGFRQFSAGAGYYVPSIAAANFSTFGTSTSTGSVNIDHSHNFNTGGMSANASHGHPLTGSVGATGSGISGDAAMVSGTTDGRPAYVGFLKIMKVRRA